MSKILNSASILTNEKTTEFLDIFVKIRGPITWHSPYYKFHSVIVNYVKTNFNIDLSGCDYTSMVYSLYEDIKYYLSGAYDKIKNRMIAIVFNDLKFMSEIKDVKLTDDIRVLSDSIIDNTKIETYLKASQLFPKIFNTGIDHMLASAASRCNREYFDELISHTHSDMRSQWLSLAVQFAIKNKWLDNQHLIDIIRYNHNAFLSNLLNNLTFDEMTKYNLHKEDKSGNCFASLDVQAEKINVRKLNRNCAIIDEKNIARYGFRLLQRVLDIYPNRLDLYNNAVIDCNLSIKSNMTLETFKKLEIMMSDYMSEISLEECFNKEILDYTSKYTFGQAAHFRKLELKYYENIDESSLREIDLDMLYYLFENGINKTVEVKLFFNFRFLMIALRVDIRKFSKFNYKLWANVHKKFSSK